LFQILLLNVGKISPVSAIPSDTKTVPAKLSFQTTKTKVDSKIQSHPCYNICQSVRGYCPLTDAYAYDKCEWSTNQVKQTCGCTSYDTNSDTISVSFTCPRATCNITCEHGILIGCDNGNEEDEIIVPKCQCRKVAKGINEPQCSKKCHGTYLFYCGPSKCVCQCLTVNQYKSVYDTNITLAINETFKIEEAMESRCIPREKTFEAQEALGKWERGISCPKDGSDISLCSKTACQEKCRPHKWSYDCALGSDSCNCNMVMVSSSPERTWNNIG